MLINPEGTVAISSMRWLDGGSVWSYSLDKPEPQLVNLSGSEWLTLIGGAGNYFTAVHHSEGAAVRLTAHSYENISTTVSSIDLQAQDVEATSPWKSTAARFLGTRSVWSSLPKAYIIHALKKSLLLLVDAGTETAQIHSLSWYAKSYDTMYQGIIGVTEVADGSLLVISFQRDSEPVLYDPTTGNLVAKLRLAGRLGSPQLFLRRRSQEIWASDYDTMVRLDSRTWAVLNSLKLQEPRNGMARSNIGQYCFNREETVCAVARPHSGDVLGIDTSSFATILRAEIGGQPEDVGVLRGDHVIARDLETGGALRGVLQPV